VLAKLESEYQKNPDSIETNRAIAEYYFNNDMLAEAELYLLRMLDIDGEKNSTYNKLGVIYFKQSQYDKAEHNFMKALEENSKIAEAHFNLAFVYQAQERFAEALSYYKEAANIERGDPETYYLMGQCAQAVNMLDEAEAFFAESFRLAPTTETAIALSIMYIIKEKYLEAEDLLTFILDLVENGTKEEHPQDDQLLNSDLDEKSLNFALGLVLAKQGKYMNAIKRLRKTAMMDERNERAYNYLGECCAAIGLSREAESLLSKANRLAPQYPLPVINLGKLYYDQGKYHRAIGVIEQYGSVKRELADSDDQSESHDPETEVMYELLRMSYRAIGNEAGAAAAWKKFSEANSDQPGLTSLIAGSPIED